MKTQPSEMWLLFCAFSLLWFFDFILIYFFCNLQPRNFLLQDMLKSHFKLQVNNYTLDQARVNSNGRRKTKIVCTIGPSSSSREMIWKLAEAGMNVARLNMSHGDHASHQKTIDLVKEYNSQFDDKVIAIMLDTKVCCLFVILFHTIISCCVQFFYLRAP